MFLALSAVNAAGVKGFWTGKAGQAFVSTERRDALRFFASPEAASAKAALLNRMSALHGWTFTTETVEA